MKNKGLPTKGSSPQDNIDRRGQGILREKLPYNEAIIEHYQPKYPNIDGHIEFMNPLTGGSTAVHCFFQLKSSEQNKQHFDLKTGYLNYFYECPEPCLLIFVNIPQETVYWEHINKNYIEKVLGIPDLEKYTQKKVRIKFADGHTIDNNAATLLGLSRKHYESMVKDIPKGEEVASSGDIPVPYIPSEGQPKTTKAQFAKVENEISACISGLGELAELYYGFIHMLSPLYLDNRGDAKRVKILQYLNMTEAQERYVIEALQNSGLLARRGSLVYVIDAGSAKSVLSHYLDTGKIELDKLTKFFSDD